MAIKRDKTDRLFSRYVKLLSGGYCQYDDKYFGVKSRGLHCCHCFTRGKKSVRWDPDNAAALCRYHHVFLDHHPLQKTEFFIEKIGVRRYEQLAFRANQPRKFTKEDIKEIEDDLKSKIAYLEEK